LYTKNNNGKIYDMYSKIVSAGVLGVLILGTSMIVHLSLKADSYSTLTDLGELPTSVTLTGTYECLEKKEATLFSSEKCEPGMRTEGNVVYSLDFHLLEEETESDPVRPAEGDKMQVEGMFIDADMLPKNHELRKKDVRGIVSLQKEPHIF
jgi:hypothetical protein